MELKMSLPSVGLLKIMEGHVGRISRAAQGAITEAAEELKQEWRGQVTRAGLGDKLPKTIKAKVYKNKGENPSALVYTKAPHILRGWEEGATILPNKSRYLAIPTPNAPKLIARKRPTPALWKPDKYGPLQFVPARGGKPAMLIAVGVRKSFTKKTGEFRGYRAAKSTRSKRTAENVVMFILVPRAQLNDRIDIRESATALTARIPEMIEEYVSRDNA